MSDNTDNKETEYTTIRFKFSRRGPVRYLGHLDMLRYFQKVMLRAKVNIRYSEGFNPHQIMSFAYPLGVSMETLGDYMDIDVISYNDLPSLVDDLNNVMHEGIKIEGAKVIEDKSKNAMAVVYAADYEVLLKDNTLDLNEAVSKLMEKESILIRKEKCKKRNKGEFTEKDIKPGIFELSVKNENVLYMNLKSGSELNIKPSQVIDAINEDSESNLQIDMITRVNIYMLNDKEQMVSLID